MKTVSYYLDYMADEFGADGYTNLTTKVLRQFKKYLNDTVEKWELQGDMDYLKQLGMYKTKAAISGTIVANKGQNTVTLSSDPGFKAVGCDLQVSGKMYTLVKYQTGGVFSIFPAYMDADTITESYEVRFNRFPTPPYFSKVLNRKMIYLTDLQQRHEITEIDFNEIPMDNDESDPIFFQARYSMRDHGFLTEGTVASSTITVDAAENALTEDMVDMPVMFEGDNEIYHIVNIDATGKSITIDRDISTAITSKSEIYVLPKGSVLFELYPHPDEAKQIIYDYLETEAVKTGATEIIQAPSSVVLAGIDIRLAKFKKTASTSEVESLKDTFEGIKEAAKAKTVTDYTPSVKFLGSGNYRLYDDDYGRRARRTRRNPYGRRYW